MLSNLTIRKKMLLLILGLTLLTYIVTYLYIIGSVRDKALAEGKKSAALVAQKKANEVKGIVDEDLAVARILGEAIEDMTSLAEPERNSRRKELLDRSLLLYPKYDATWMSWQLAFIDKSWDKPYGRERFNSYMENGEVKSSIEMAELDGSKASAIYETMKADESMKELLSEPYWFLNYDYSNNKSDSLMAISTVVRLEVDGKFAGVVGADMSLNAFQQVSEVDFYHSAYAVLLTNNGIITSYKDPRLFNASMDSLSIFQGQLDLRESVQRGVPVDFTTYDIDLGKEVYVYVAPIPIGRTNTYWSVCTVVPIEEIMAPYNSTFTTTIIVVAISLLVLTFSIIYISNSITRPLSTSTKMLEDLAVGNLNTQYKLSGNGKDELSKISRSLNQLLHSLQVKATFAQKIGHGNLDAEIDVDKNDVLGMALVNMQKSLTTAIGDIKSLVKASESISDNVVLQAENIHHTAHNGFETSNTGLSLVDRMSESMNAITSIASQTNTSFKALEERSKEISGAINAITDLSRKTNLLAINAAIEASSAGAAGKGFAVIAREIRQLAEGSEKSAKGITDLVAQMQTDTAEASKMIAQMTERIHQGESAAVETTSAFRNINTSVNDTVTLSESILSIARQQISKIKEVARNTESMVIQ